MLKMTQIFTRDCLESRIKLIRVKVIAQKHERGFLSHFVR